MKLLLIDNFDSFVYNIYQSAGSLGHEVEVVRNNAVTVKEIEEKNYDAVIISPGPGTPENAKDFGVCKEVLQKLNKPILGICLGCQGIISVFGGKVIRAKKPMHGKTSLVTHDSKGIFEGAAMPLRVMRYHSLIGEKESLPFCLEITAKSEEGEIMAVRHKSRPIFGVQFHPESIMTEDGMTIFKNFFKSVT